MSCSRRCLPRRRVAVHAIVVLLAAMLLATVVVASPMQSVPLPHHRTVTAIHAVCRCPHRHTTNAITTSAQSMLSHASHSSCHPRRFQIHTAAAVNIVTSIVIPVSSLTQFLPIFPSPPSHTLCYHHHFTVVAFIAPPQCSSRTYNPCPHHPVAQLRPSPSPPSHTRCWHPHCTVGAIVPAAQLRTSPPSPPSHSR